MERKLPFRILASLILSAMLFVMPLCAFLANDGNTTKVYAEESVSGNDIGDGAENDGADDGSTDDGDTDGDTEEERGEGESEEETAVCTCDSKCSQYDTDADCPVCSADYTKCAYKNPSVKITINAPSGWYGSGSSAKVTFKAEDILDTGNFAIKSVKAKIGQNGSYQDVTEDMYLEISENCSVYVLVTDANDKSYERSRSIRCFDTTKPTLNAAVSDGLLTVQASDNDSGVKVIYVNGYEFTDITNGTLNIRLSQFDAGYEYFTITAMDNAGNVSEVYKTKNPYYKDPESDDDSNPAEQLPVSAEATKPSSATAEVTDHTKTDADGNTTSSTSAEEQKKVEFAKADAEEAALAEGEDDGGGDMNLGKEFYTIEAASGKVFYLIIDRDGEEEVVYFLTEITENDLLNVTTDNSETLPKNSAALESQIPITESALPNNNTDYEETKEVETPTEEPNDDTEDTEAEPDTEQEEAGEPAKSNPLVGYIIMGILGAGVIVAAYYLKVVRKKPDGDFVEDEDEEEDDEYESEETESESGDDDFFNDTQEEQSTETEAGDERSAPDEADAADTIGDEYESDSDEE